MAETTVSKIPLIQTVVHRDGKPVRPEIGKVYAYTASEVAEIEKFVPGALRDPIVEVTADATATATTATASTTAKVEEEL